MPLFKEGGPHLSHSLGRRSPIGSNPCRMDHKADPTLLGHKSNMTPTWPIRVAPFSGLSGQERECDHSQANQGLFWVLICEPKRELESLKVPMPTLPASRAHLREVHTEKKAERHPWHLVDTMIGWVPRKIPCISSHSERYCSWETYKEWFINSELARNSQTKTSYSPSSCWMWMNPFQSYSGKLSKTDLSSKA